MFGSRIAGRLATSLACEPSRRELVALQPDAVLAVTTPAVTALLHETRTVPIVFVRVSDPSLRLRRQPGEAQR